MVVAIYRKLAVPARDFPGDLLSQGIACPGGFVVPGDCLSRGISCPEHMTLDMSVGIMKSDWETGIMMGYLHMVADRKCTLENISPQFLLLYYEMIPCPLIFAPDYSTGIHILSIFGQELRGNIY